MPTEIPYSLVTVAAAPILAQVAELLGPNMRLRLIKEEPDAAPDMIGGISYSLLLTAEQYALLEPYSTEPDQAPGYAIGGPLP